MLETAARLQNIFSALGACEFSECDCSVVLSEDGVLAYYRDAALQVIARGEERQKRRHAYFAVTLLASNAI